MKQRKEFENFLKRDWVISQTVEKRLDDIYKQLERKEGKVRIMRRKKFKKAFATVAAASVVGIVSLSSVLAATGQTEKIAGTVKSAFNKILGKEEKEAVTGLFGDGVESYESKVAQSNRNGKASEVKIPAAQRIAVDEQLENEIFDGFISTEPIVKKQGDFTFTLYNYVTDGQSVCAYMSVEQKGGVNILTCSDLDNSPVGKGVYWHMFSQFHIEFVGEDGTVLSEKTIVDSKKSTDEKYYLYLYGTWGKEEEESPKWHITIDGKQYEYTLPKVNTLELNYVKQDGKAIISYSPISMKLDIQTLFQSLDPVSIKKLEIKFKDGSVYTLMDREEIYNVAYTCGFENGWEYEIFNRVIDVKQVSEIIINGKAYQVDNN